MFSSFRIGWKAERPEQYGLYVHCQTSLIESFRTHYPQELEYQGKRAVLATLCGRKPSKRRQNTMMEIEGV